MSGTIGGIRDAATESLQDIGQQLVKWLGRAWQLIRDSVTHVVETIKNAFNQLMSMIKSDESARLLSGKSVVDSMRTFVNQNRTASVAICGVAGTTLFCLSDQAENSVVRSVGRAAGIAMLGLGVFMVMAPEALGLPRV